MYKIDFNETLDEMLKLLIFHSIAVFLTRSTNSVANLVTGSIQSNSRLWKNIAKVSYKNCVLEA